MIASRELERWTSREVIKATSVSHVRLTSVVFFTNADRSCGVCSAAQRLVRMKDTSSTGSHGKDDSAEEDVEAATGVAASWRIGASPTCTHWRSQLDLRRADIGMHGSWASMRSIS